MSTLPAEFIFTQSNLQDFQDCRRRFQLRQIDRMHWPALETEPALEHEHLMDMGNQLHQLAHQLHLGLEPEQLSPFVQDPVLERWWQHLLDHYPEGLPEQRLAELTLSASLAGHRVSAKFDLVAVSPGEKIVIMDWKTSRTKPTSEQMSRRIQTRLYQYVLAEAGTHLNGGQAIDPEQIEMMYWFAEFPTEPIRFSYSQHQHEQTEAELSQLISELKSLRADQFPLTDNLKRCTLCQFRSYCDRGVEAAPLADWSAEAEEIDLDDLNLNLDQIQEIEF
jgi:CRISPR/Cas system-associated exonuclease Cas4 (RecB family)